MPNPDNDDSILENMMRTLGLTNGHDLYSIYSGLYRCRVCSYHGPIEDIELTCVEQQNADFDYDAYYGYGHDEEWTTDKDDPTEEHGGKH